MPPTGDLGHGHRSGHRHYLSHRRRRTESEISCCVKYMVFGFNVIFWIVGVTVFLIGVWAQIEKNPLSQIGTRLSKFYLDPAWLFIVVGGVTFIIGFSGCVGALRENTCLLSVYSVLVGILLLIELAIGILGFVFKDWVKNQLANELNEMIVFYREDPDLQSVIDWIQMDWLHCCGINGPNDWDKNVYFSNTSRDLGSPEADGVPFSCCFQKESFINYYCGHGVRKLGYTGDQLINLSGCLPRAQEWFTRNMIVVGSVAVAVAVLELNHDQCRRIYCDGCLVRGRVWLERYFAIIGGLAFTIVVMEILGICFAQNLRSDILAQRARWEYQER